MSLCRLTSPPAIPGSARGWAVGCLLAGALAGGAFPPYDVWPLILPALAVLCLAARRLAPGAAFRAGWLWGLALAAGQLNWILVVLTEYGDLSWFLAVPALLILTGYLALYPAAFAALLARLGRGGIGQMVAAPVAWLGLEWLRGEALTGFPWLPLGAALTGELRLIQGAELVGALGLSGLLVLLGALLARALERGTLPGRLACLAAGEALLALGWFWGGERIAAVRAAMDRAPRLTVSVVQGDVPIRELWDPRRRLAIVERHLALTRSQAGGVGERPWLVVWSESAAPFVFGRDPLPSELILAGARDLAADIIFGTIGLVPKDGQNRLTNRSALATARGEPGGEYDKVHLVPFGEYVPWGRVLFFVRALATVGGDHLPGAVGSTIHGGGVELGPLICYESIFAELAREQKRRGARLIVNQTNDAWFGRTGASAQHLSHLRLRAVENRLAVARAANSGISGFILPDGSSEGLTGLFVAAAETRRLPLMDLTTIHARLGDLPGPIALGLAGLGLLAAWWRGRGKEEEDVRGA